jgi:hypothetical protein
LLISKYSYETSAEQCFVKRVERVLVSFVDLDCSSQNSVRKTWGCLLHDEKINPRINSQKTNKPHNPIFYCLSIGADYELVKSLVIWGKNLSSSSQSSDWTNCRRFPANFLISKYIVEEPKVQHVRSCRGLVDKPKASDDGYYFTF